MQRIFQTTDSDLAVYLWAQGYALLGTSSIQGRIVFAFPADADLSADAYYNGAAVSAKKFLYTLHKLGLLGRVFNSGDSRSEQSNASGKTCYASAV
jgi:hypothetical protein